MKKSSMRVLLIDIETAPGVAYIWSLWDKFIPIDRLIKPGYTLCWAAKWLGSSDIMFRSIYHDGKDVMLQELYDILSSADAVITFNGDKFDIPTINREFLEAGITPPSPAHSVDLYKTVKRRFRLMSNKLDFVCQTLGIGGKVKHKGMALWYECMSGVDNHGTRCVYTTAVTLFYWRSCTSTCFRGFNSIPTTLCSLIKIVQCVPIVVAIMYSQEEFKLPRLLSTRDIIARTVVTG